MRQIKWGFRRIAPIGQKDNKYERVGKGTTDRVMAHLVNIKQFIVLSTRVRELMTQRKREMHKLF